MNKKGFTLLEIISVITIIVMLSLIIIPIVDKNIKDAQDFVTSTQVSYFEEAASLYAMNYRSEIPELDTDKVTTVTLQTLLDKGLIEEKKLKTTSNNPIPLSTNIIIAIVQDNIKTVYDKNQENKPLIILHGPSKYAMTIHNPYTELGASVLTFSPKSVIELTSSNITSNVNKDVAGTYSVTYSYSEAASVTRQVIVSNGTSSIDKTKPVISLVGNTSINIAEGSIYIDSGATALDIEEGNISSRIIATGEVNTTQSGTYYKKYNVTDLSGNKAATITRTINVYNGTVPVITLSGSNPMDVEEGSSYAEPGATAIDDHDGSITNNIFKTGTIDTSIPGTYTITYNVNNSLGNPATPVVRTVRVKQVYSTAKGVNLPQLTEGMTPIKWNGTAWVNTTADDPDWYSYTTTDKKWANAKTADGSFWVWIPRYIYKISSGWHSGTTGTIDIQFSKGTNDNWNSATIGNIDTGTTSNASNNKWTNHPAFTFDTTQLKGIWVAKLEASVSNTSDLCYTSESDTNCNKTTLTPKIVPNVKSWRYISIGNMFTVSRSMETNSTYGWGTSGTGIDTHMMKNVEWGAVAYLSKSVYGKNAEIWINPANNYTTGCAGDSVSSGATTGCLRTYETSNGQQASTTGNIYGIYDMSGGAYDYTVAYINNANTNLTTYGNNILTENAKYKDVYTVTTDSAYNNYNNAIDKKGDAVYEISSASAGATSWFSDYSSTPYNGSPWFTHGGNCYSGTGAGTFNFNVSVGYPVSTTGFRPVIAVANGL